MGKKPAEDFTYTVKRLTPTHYEVNKWGDGAEPEEQYDVTIPPVTRPGSTIRTIRLFCSCQGFRRQTYAPERHKHIKLVQTWIQQKEPMGRIYRMDGVGADVTIVVVAESPFVANPNAFDPSN